MKKSIRLVLAVVYFFSLLVSFHETKASSDFSQKVVMLSINGPINAAANDFIHETLNSSEASGALALVIKLNTPGGLITSMQTIVERILAAKIPVIVYVTPAGGSATSAGVFVTLAGHVAAMTPGTTIGAAHPVSGGGETIEGDMRKKIENFTVSLIKAIAEQRGRNTKWAEEAVRESVSITDKEALEKKVIDYLAADLNALFSQIEGKTVQVQGKQVSLSGLLQAEKIEVAMSFKQKVLNVLSDPNVTVLLGLGAVVGLGAELYHPGIGFPGIVGAICLVLSLVSSQVVPINIGGVLLLILGAVFFTVEFMVPSFGLWGIAGIVSFVLGSIYLVDTEVIWSVSGMNVEVGFVASVAVTMGLVLLGIVYLAINSRGRKVTTGQEGLPGKHAEVVTDFSLNPNTGKVEGKVFVSGEIWKAQVEDTGNKPKTGAQVRIEAILDGMILLVK